MRTDLEMQDDVREELNKEPIVDAAAIGVSAGVNGVVLKGTVKNYAQKWAAGQAAQRAAGAKHVTNQLSVKLPAADERTDDDLARTAMYALDWNVLIPRNHVGFVVEEGRITLKGNVEFHFQKAEAERTVRTLVGLRDLNDEIAVKVSLSAEEIKTNIQSALEFAAGVDAQNIRVEAKDGVVTLRGTVRSIEEKETAERAAWTAPGVSAVKNSLQIAA